MTTQHEPTIQKLFDLTGKGALVTGGTSHLGAAMARALAEAGATVVVSSRDRSKAEAAAAQLPTDRAAAHFGIQLDHMNTTSIEECFARSVELTGHIDVLVNNAYEPPNDDWTGIVAEEFNRQLANATGYFLLARLLHDHVVQRNARGSIIMVGSKYGLAGSYPDILEGIELAKMASYHVLKGGVIPLTQHLATYWADDQIRVNCLVPGPFPPPAVPAEVVERMRSHCPMKRIGRPHELKGAVVFLASEAGSYMTGQNLVVDGGWTAW